VFGRRIQYRESLPIEMDLLLVTETDLLKETETVTMTEIALVVELRNHNQVGYH